MMNLSWSSAAIGARQLVVHEALNPSVLGSSLHVLEVIEAERCENYATARGKALYRFIEKL